MAANVESMFSVGEKPWHGLGVEIKEAPTSKDAIVLAGLDWKVLEKNAYDERGKVVPGIVLNTRDKDHKVLGYVTERYKIVQNEEAFAFTDLLLGEGITYETAGSLASGKRTWMLARMPTIKILDDDVSPYLVFSNSFDGSGAIKIASTPVRVVCQNTLTMALQRAPRVWSTKHMGDMASKLKEAEETLLKAKNYNQELEITAQVLVETKISDDDFKQFVHYLFPLPEKKEQAGMSNRKLDNILYHHKALNFLYNDKEDIQRFKGTAWGVANAIADYMPHIKPLRQTSLTRENSFINIVDKSEMMEKFSDFFAA